MRNDTEGETPNPEMEIVSDLLPELIEEHQNHAASKESISWILNLLGHYRPGDVHDDGYGVLLQKVAFDTFRCIRVFNHPETLYSLSTYLRQFDHANVVLEIGSCTVLTPLPKEVIENTLLYSREILKTDAFIAIGEKKVIEDLSVSGDATKSSDYNVEMEVA